MDLLNLKLHAFSDYFLPESQNYFSFKKKQNKMKKTPADECSCKNTQIHWTLAIFFINQGLSSKSGHYIPLQLQELCSTTDKKIYWGKQLSLVRLLLKNFMTCRFLNVSEKQRN